MAGGNPAAFAAGVLRGIGAPVTNQNIAGFIGWSKAEGPLGGDSWARNNPLNTTLSTGGATGTINSAGVKAYRNMQAGVNATVQTLRQGNFGGIVGAFKANNPHALAGAIGSSDWGTSGSLVAQTIQQTLGQKFSIPSTMPGAPRGTQGGVTQGSVNLLPTYKTVTKNVFDQAGYQQAQKASIAANYLKGSESKAADPYAAGQPSTGLGTANPLVSLLGTAKPNPQDYTNAQTTLQKIAGGSISAHPNADPNVNLSGQALRDAGAVGAKDASKLLGMIKQVVGAPYSQANHNAISERAAQIKAQGTDCSGLISWLMGPNGLGFSDTSLATPSIDNAPGIQQGRGRVITIYNNKQAGNAGHVFIQIGNTFFASEGGVGVHQLPASEVKNYLQNGSDGGTYEALHPKGL